MTTQKAKDEAKEAKEAEEAPNPIPTAQESAPLPASRGAPTDSELADVAARAGLNAALDDLVQTVHAVAPQLAQLVEEWDTYAREDQGPADRAYALKLLVDRTRALNDRLQKVAAPNVAQA